MSLFRGISFIILGDQAYRGYPPEFAYFGQGYVWWVISFEFVLFAIIAVIYAVLLHLTSFGRAVFAIGNNATGALFSGIRVGRAGHCHVYRDWRALDWGHRLAPVLVTVEGMIWKNSRSKCT